MIRRYEVDSDLTIHGADDGRQPETYSRLIRHLEPVRYPGENIVGDDVPSAGTSTHDDADLALRHPDGHSDTGLAGPGVLAEQPEKHPYVAVSQCRQDAVLLPEPRGDPELIEHAPARGFPANALRWSSPGTGAGVNAAPWSAIPGGGGEESARLGAASPICDALVAQDVDDYAAA